MKTNETGQNPDTLTDRQARAIPLILSARTITEGCKKAGISPSQFYEWQKDPTFQAEYDRQRKALTEAAYRILEHTLSEAAGVFQKLLKSKLEHVRRLAALNVFELHSKYIENKELADRVKAIEQKLYEDHTKTTT